MTDQLTTDPTCFLWLGKSGRNLWGIPREFEGTGSVRANVCLADLDGDAALEIVATSERFFGKETPADHWCHNLGRVYVLDPRTGDTRPGYQRNFDMGIMLGGIADIDNDGRPDILVGTITATPPGEGLLALRADPGLPDMCQFHLPGRQLRCCAINDINGDGNLEVIVVASVPSDAPTESTLYILDSHLKELCTWQTQGQLNNAVVSDLNGDGINEIIVLYDYRVGVLSATSPSLPPTAGGSAVEADAAPPISNRH